MARISFTEHPASVGETYFGHLRAASGFGWYLLVTAGACLLHALCPWLCTHTARNRIDALHAELQQRSAGHGKASAKRQPAPLGGLATGTE